MAAITHFTAAISILTILSGASASSSFPAYPSCLPTTKTVYTTVTVADGWKPATAATTTSKAASGAKGTAVVSPLSQQYTPPVDFTYPGVVFPTYSPKDPNPNGPFYNPNDYLPQPLIWPGKPVSGQLVPSPVPSGRPRPIGGSDAEKYAAPAWCKKGSNLKPDLSQDDTNGDSYWGLIDCPRLSSYVGPSGGSVVASATSSGYGHKSSKTSSELGYGATTTSGAFSHSGHFSSSESLSFSKASSYSVPGNNSFSRSSSEYPSQITSSGFSKVSSSSSAFSPSSSQSSSSFHDRCALNNTVAACGKIPNTGVTRHYDFSVAYGVVAPDGVQKVED